MILGDNVMIEKIGNVKLNMERYSGRDEYSDGDIEDTLLDIVKNTASEDYNSVIKEKSSWPVFYHLSPIRGNCVEWLDIDKNMSVLEIGSGCGAVTGTLAKKAGSLTCIELSKKRSLINAERNKEFDNIEIIVGNFKDIDLKNKFDMVTLIGVLEYSEGYIGGKTPYEDMLSRCFSYLKKGGRLVIAIENKFGLKYWAGCKEDHVGRYFESIENYGSTSGVRTFTKYELEKLLKGSGADKVEFYYPYPDYKFTSTVYSDAYLPKKGELNDNIRNFDNARLITFDEGKVFDTIIENNLFPLYSNSFLVIAEV